MAISHTNIPHTHFHGACRRREIDELARRCDAAFYMAAIKEPDARDVLSFKNDIASILEDIAALKILRDEVTCPGCLAEIGWQIPFQADALEYLRDTWRSAGFKI
jgi:hypothetical protein